MLTEMVLIKKSERFKNMIIRHTIAIHGDDSVRKFKAVSNSQVKKDDDFHKMQNFLKRRDNLFRNISC